MATCKPMQEGTGDAVSGQMPQPEPPGVLPTAEQIRDALLSLPDNERIFVISDPKPGDHKIIAIRRNADGLVKYDFEDVPES